MEDSVLISAALEGDQESFALLVKRYRRLIYVIAYKIVLNEDDALDVTQTVYLRLVEKLSTYQGRGTFRGWVSQMAAREAISLLRRTSRRETPTEAECIEALCNDHREEEPDLREELDRRKVLGYVEEAMHEISPQQRAILALRLKEDMGPKEISGVLGMEQTQVRSQTHRAIEKIKDILARKSGLIRT